MSATTLSTVNKFILFLQSTPSGRYYPHFTDEKTKVQKD